MESPDSAESRGFFHFLTQEIFPFGPRNPRIKPMKKSIVLFTLSLLPLAAVAEETGAPPSFDVAWRKCAKATDCQVIDSECGWRGINRASVSKALTFYKSNSPRLDCEATPKDKPAASCEKELCGPGAEFK
jgi:hypothetical protein